MRQLLITGRPQDKCQFYFSPDLLAECKDVIANADEKMMAMTNEDYTVSGTS